MELLCAWSESCGTYAMTHCGTFLFSYRVRNACCSTPIHTHTHGDWQRAIAVFVSLFLCMLASLFDCNARSETMRARIFGSGGLFCDYHYEFAGVLCDLLASIA